VVVNLFGKIPWLGFLAFVAIWLIGIGALCWNTWATLRGFGHRAPHHA
jgi:hypothetical protein